MEHIIGQVMMQKCAPDYFSEKSRMQDGWNWRKWIIVTECCDIARKLGSFFIIEVNG
jgi:hypothetical protein